LSQKEQFILTVIAQIMLFYKAITTKNVITEVVCVVLIAALTPALTHFMLRFGKEGFEFIKKRIAALRSEG